MKQIAALLITLTLLLTMAGCGGKETPKTGDASPPVPSGTLNGEGHTQEPVKAPEPSEPEKAPEPSEPEAPKGPVKSSETKDVEKVTSPTLAERLAGVYRSYDDLEADEHLIHIISVGGTLVIEHQLLIEDCLYSFWAQELRPKDAKVLFGGGDAVSAPNLSFSYMSAGGQYWTPVTELTAVLSDGGVSLTETANGQRSEVEFARLDDVQSLHEISKEDCQAYGLVQTKPVGEALVGDWCYADGNSAVWLSLRADGSFLGALKLPSEPIKVNIGAWGIDGNGDLAVLAERPETGTMPYLWRLEWEKTGSGLELSVIASYDDYLLPGDGSCTLRPAAADWRIPDALYGGAAASDTFVYEDMRSGAFVNPDTGDSIDYAYSMQLLDDALPGAVEFNTDMNQSIGKLIWAQWYAIENGGIPDYTSISCQAYEYEGLCSFVYTLTRWIDNQDEYEVYWFDRDAGTWLYSDDVLKRLDLDRFSQFLPACVAAGQAQIMDAYAGISLSREELDDLLDMTKQFVGLYGVEPFVTDDGTVWATIPVASIVGADYYYSLLPLNPGGSWG